MESPERVRETARSLMAASPSEASTAPRTGATATAEENHSYMNSSSDMAMTIIPSTRP